MFVYLNSTPAHTTQKAKSAPMLVKSLSSSSGTNRANTAEIAPQNSTDTMGVWVLG